jgi:hypothetical protein
VPAFAGLGAPHWDADARGALFGLTRATGPNEIARAALESVCFQTLDLVEAMQSDCGTMANTVLRVDGGMVVSDWTMQRLADILGAPVDRPTIRETTALGAAYLAGLQSGPYAEPSTFAARWALDRRFTAAMDETNDGDGPTNEPARAGASTARLQLRHYGFSRAAASITSAFSGKSRALLPASMMQRPPTISQLLAAISKWASRRGSIVSVTRRVSPGSSSTRLQPTNRIGIAGSSGQRT